MVYAADPLSEVDWLKRIEEIAEDVLGQGNFIWIKWLIKQMAIFSCPLYRMVQLTKNKQDKQLYFWESSKNTFFKFECY